MKTGKSKEKSFTDQQQALDYAKEISHKHQDKRFIIQCEEQFFVSTTDNVQSYEKLIAVFKSGNKLVLQS